MLREARSVWGVKWKPTGFSVRRAGVFCLVFLAGVAVLSIVNTQQTEADGEINVYYSVGQNTTDHKTGSPTLIISGGVGTFSVAQTATNMGVGDKVTFNTSSVCYISSKTSTTVWNLVTALGANCGDVTGATVNSIAHAFSSMNAAVGGVTPGASGASFLNSSDLVTGNYILNIPTYYDSGSDTTAVSINGWTTGANNYINIYTPSDTTTEVNQTQRHNGIWESAKYNLTTTNATALRIAEDYVRLNGLQIKTASGSGILQHVIDYTLGTYTAGTNRHDVSNSILVGHNNVTYYQSAINSQNNQTLNVWNMLAYNFAPAGSTTNRVIYGRGTLSIYSSTIIGGYYAASKSNGTLVCKNCYVGGSSNGDYHNAPTLTTSASSDTTGSSGLQSIAVNTTNFTNVSSGTEDFRLPGAGSALYNVGTSTSGDTAPLNFTVDINNTTRPSGGSWDIGADEYEVPVDSEDPVITVFTIPTTASSRSVTISSFTATDNVGVTGYKITESSTAPIAEDVGWSGFAPTTYTITGAGTSHTLYAWVKDAYGNVSVNLNDAITVTPASASCSYADVMSELGISVSGDTLLVPAGSCVWGSQLAITKNIKLQGAGVEDTIITSSLAAGSTDATFLIKVTIPDASSNFSIEGLTFDFNNISKGLKIINSSLTPALIDITQNRFSNCYSATYNCLEINGTIHGVVHNNTFDGYPHFDIYGIGSGGLASWNGLTFTYGGANKLYFEDNIITIDSATSVPAFGTVGHGGSVVYRYNDYIYENTYGLFPWFDNHGNQTSSVYSSMGMESYGNDLIANSITPGNDIRAFHHRGGKALFFNNLVTSTSGTPSILVNEESSDSISPTNYGSTASDGQPQHVSDSYYWSNYKGSTPFTISAVNEITDPALEYQLTENVDFFNHDTSFDGTTGTGVGVLASRPSTCTTGVGYWATNQSVSVLTGMVGANPETPISGTLYKCTSSNTWSTYFTPYTYPHPLRGESELVAPVTGNSGTILTASITDSSIILNWTEATDDVSAQTNLQYRVYQSLSNNLSTITDIETNGTPLNVFTADISTYSVTGLSASTPYYFNVIVKDEAGNKSAYSVKSETTSASSGGGGGSSRPTPTPAPPALNSTSIAFANIKLVVEGQTFYVIKDGHRYGVTNPGILFSYGLEYKDGQTATSNDNAIPYTENLKPGDGTLVKKPGDSTVYLIFDNSKHGFTSEAVFNALGYSFLNVLEVTANELDALLIGTVVADPYMAHPSGTFINQDGTIFRIYQNVKYGIPSMDVYNSFNADNSFTHVVPANVQDRLLPVGSVLDKRQVR